MMKCKSKTRNGEKCRFNAVIGTYCMMHWKRFHKGQTLSYKGLVKTERLCQHPDCKRKTMSDIHPYCKQCDAWESASTKWHECCPECSELKREAKA